MNEQEIHFWATLAFEKDQLKDWLLQQVNLSNAPWRPGFFYSVDEEKGYMIFPVAFDGGEFGFRVLNPDFWENVHRHRLKVGLTFLLGPTRSHLQATGVVTRISVDQSTSSL